MDDLSPSELLVSIHQPNFFPRTNVLTKIFNSDLWIVLDDVQFASREWQNRAKLSFLKTPQIEYWLTLPIIKIRGQRTLINQVVIADNWNPCRALRSLQRSYSRSISWNIIHECAISTFSKDFHNDFLSITIASAERILRYLGWGGKILFSSSLVKRNDKNLRLLDICKSVGAYGYLCGSGGREYLNSSVFLKEKIKLFSINPILSSTMKISKRRWCKLSFLDLLAHSGEDQLQALVNTSKNYLIELH